MNEPLLKQSIANSAGKLEETLLLSSSHDFIKLKINIKGAKRISSPSKLSKCKLLLKLSIGIN